MLDFHPTSLKNDSKNIKKHKNNKNLIYSQNFPLNLSTELKSQQLPFIRQLKQIRGLLINLKNDKLRRSHYNLSANRFSVNQTKPLSKHSKAKLSVMDLISEQGYVDDIKNIIKVKTQQNQQDKGNYQHNQNQNQNLVIQNDMQGVRKTDNYNNNIHKKMYELPRVSNIKYVQKPLSLSKKNLLASELNKIGHRLEQTYFQVQQMQIIFQNLCSYYSENKHHHQKNTKLKTDIERILQILSEYNQQISNNSSQMAKISQQKNQFIAIYKQNMLKYVKQMMEFNIDNDIAMEQIRKFMLNSFNKDYNTVFLNKKNIEEQESKQNSDKNSDNDNQPLSMNLKYDLLRLQMERLKCEKKAQNIQGKQGKSKGNNNSNNEENFSFHKFYTSQLYTL